MKEKEENLELLKARQNEAPKSLNNIKGPDSLQRVFKEYSSPRLFIDQNRFTYTFILDGEVSSIHYDSKRFEIFYKGHNIRNMNLNKSQVQMLNEMTSQIAAAGEKSLSESYLDCLNKNLNS